MPTGTRRPRVAREETEAAFPAAGTPPEPRTGSLERAKAAVAERQAKGVHLGGAWHELFLAAFREVGNITVAAELCGVARTTVMTALRYDADFQVQFELCKDTAIEKLEHVARERAIKQSDLLLIFLLKGARPEKYRDNYRPRETDDAKEQAAQVIDLGKDDATYRAHLRELCDAVRNEARSAQDA
jgi:hypothetical protein